MRILAALLVVSSVLLADTITLKDGTKVEGKILGTANGKTGIKTIEGKTLWIDQDQIDKVDKGDAQKPPADAPPKDPSAGPQAGAPPQTPPKEPVKEVKGPKCPKCRGRKVVKCTKCQSGMIEDLCPKCQGGGWINCPKCNGSMKVGGAWCTACRNGRIDCPNCKGTRLAMVPCPECKGKKVVECPVCKGTGVDPAPPPQGQAADPKAAQPEPDDDAPLAAPPAPDSSKPAAKQTAPPLSLSSPALEAQSGVVDGITRTDGRKLWRLTVKLTNAGDLGTLVVRPTDFSVKVGEKGEVKALEPAAGSRDSRPVMLGKGKAGQVALYFETAYEEVPKKLLFTTPKWKGDPFTVDIPAPK